MGRALRSHRERRHSAARVRRPYVQAAVPRRRPHGPGDDPHAAGPRRADGFRRLHGMHDHEAAERRRPRFRRIRVLARVRAFRHVQGEVDRNCHRRHREILEDHVELLGMHGRRNGAGLRSRRRATGHGIRAISSHRHGLAAGSAGNSGYRSGARRRWTPAQQERRALHGEIRSEEAWSFRRATWWRARSTPK